MSTDPARLPRGELLGLRVRVAAAADPGLVGVAGRVVGETHSTLRVEDRPPSAGTASDGAASDDAASAEDATAADGSDRTADGSDRADGGGADRTADGTDRPGGAPGDRRVRQVPKPGTVFEFAVGPEEAPSVTDGRGLGTDAAEPLTEVVTVAGDRIVARPARRTERAGDPVWR